MKTTTRRAAASNDPEHGCAQTDQAAARSALGPCNPHIVKVDAMAETDEAPDEGISDEPAVVAEVPEGFRIDDAAKASWAVRKILEARGYAARVKRWAEQELRRAERDERWLLARFGPELEAWLRAELARRGGRSRSVPLPGGTLGLRRQPPRVDLLDELAAAAWCERHLPEALRVMVEVEGNAARDLARWHHQHEEDARLRKQVLREPLNRYAAASGELPDGTSLVGGEERLYVK